MSDDDLKITISVRGLCNDPEVAAQRMLPSLKRSLFCVDGIPGGFGARIDMPGGAWELDENREWQRVRDSNSRGPEPSLLSGQAP